LTAVGIKALKKPGRYADGNGLYLKISRSGAKRWELRTVVRGKRCDIGLGGLKLVSLAEAREEARKYRQVARNDGDPLADRRRSRLVVPTFREAAETVHKAHAKAWKNPKHGDQFDTPDILKALSPIWMTKPETARRVRQRIGTVLDWAKAAGHRAGSNPVKEISKALPRQSDRKGHHAALPYTEVVCSEASRLQRNYPQPGIRVSDPDRGADQRSAQGQMERERPGASGLDDSSQPHEGRQGAPRPAGAALY
jgi:hypothetical protein